MKDKKIYKLAEDAYNLSCLIKHYIQSNLFIDELHILSTSVDTMHKKLDTLYAELINMQER